MIYDSTATIWYIIFIFSKFYYYRGVRNRHFCRKSYLITTLPNLLFYQTIFAKNIYLVAGGKFKLKLIAEYLPC